MEERLAEALRKALPGELRELARALKTRGFRAWAVGGSVRDIVRAEMQGKALHFSGDWDVATDAEPADVQKTFRKVIPTGLAHGTVTVVLGNAAIEVTTLRGERGHTDGRRPDEVFFVSNIQEDLARRDFTVNAIAFDLDQQQIIDPFDGQGDLRRALIRAVGDAHARYTEDGLRPLRAARFSAQLEMDLEPATRAAIRPTLERFRLVSKERVRDEWLKALRSKQPSRFFKILCSEGLLEATLPGLFSGAHLDQVEGVLALVDKAAPDPIRRLAHFMSAATGEGAPATRAERASLALGSLRMANKERERIARLIVAEAIPELDPEQVRRYLARTGREHAEDVIEYLSERGVAPALLRLMRAELQSGVALSPRELVVSGHDLLGAGVPGGPHMKEILSVLLDRVLEDPSRNQREILMAEAARVIREKNASAI